MKLVKSLLLGSAAGLVAVAGAQAADLPVRKAAPVVEYVRVCSTYGAGFFYIPGTETCLRVSGRVRAEYLVGETYLRGQDAIGWRARGRLNFDARTATAYGTLRTFIRLESTYNSGIYQGGAFGGGFAGGVTDSGPLLNKAFIQFAGITAGRATSFFDFYANDLNWGGLPTGSDSYGADPALLAYTATFGSGFSATISLEDPASKRAAAGFAGLPAFPGAAPVGIVYAGQRAPDLVGNLRVDQAWGSAQLSAALHQINTVNREPGVIVGPGGVLVANPGAGNLVDNEFGWAIQGGVKLNLPMLAPGDVLWLQGTYANGAINYLGFGGGGFALGRAAVTVADGFVFNGDIEKTEGWQITAALLHYWTPEIRQAVFATYGSIDVPNQVRAAAFPVTPATVAAGTAGAFAAGSVVGFDWWQIGTNLTWSPVSALDIGIEVLYRNIDPDGRVVTRFAPPDAVTTVGNEDVFEGRLRIQRDF